MVINSFSIVIWGAISMSNSTTGGASESACLAESADQAHCAETSFCKLVLNILIVEGFEAATFARLPKILS